MELGHLRSFLEVAARGSFTRAAQALFITQPAVSQHIQALEAHYGVPLFERRGRGVTLTPAGRALRERTQQLLEHWKSLDTLVEDFAGLRRGRLVVASTTVVGTYVLSPALATFVRAYPGVELAIRHGNTLRVGQMVQDGEADLGFGGDSRMVPRALWSLLVHREPIVLVTAPDNPLLRRERLTAADLRECVLVWREQGTLAREYLERYFGGGPLSSGRLEVDQVELAKRLAEEGGIIAAVPRAAIQREVKSGQLKILRLARFGLRAGFNLLVSRGRPSGKPAQAFLSHVMAAGVLSETEAVRDRLQREGLLLRP